MSDKNQNLNCRFAEDLVAYLYDEIGKREKAIFETHLPECSSCKNELAAFSSARFAVSDWRKAEFASLETPIFEIPFEQKVITVSRNAESGFFGWRRIFSFAPVWATSAAALALILGLFFAASHLMQPDLIADQKNPVPAVLSDSNVLLNENRENKSAEKIEAMGETEVAGTFAEKTTSLNKSEATEKSADSPQVQASKARKISDAETAAFSAKNKSERPRSENIAATKSKNAGRKPRQSATGTGKQVPTLNSFEDEDDNTLRLAELFEQIEASR